MAKSETLLAFEPRTESARKPGPSDRAFGLTFAVGFALMGLAPLLHHGKPRIWALAVGAAFLAVALLLPKLLGPLNFVWMRLAAVLNRIMTPIILGMLFFGVITPMAFVMRRLRHDPLELIRREGKQSYWVVRQPPGPDPQTMTRQY